MSIMIVAEISGEHCGSISKARDLIAAAKLSGADAVKFQFFEPRKLADARGGGLCTKAPWIGIPLYELYRQTQTPRHWFAELFEYATKLNIVAFSSVFDNDGVDFLETLNCPMYKISSFERDDLDLILHAHETGKPLIISGPHYRHPHPLRNASYLYCVSEYPTPLCNAHLKRMVEGRYDGFSDHTLGISAPIAAAALGAKIIEKHITLDRDNGGPDASFAIEPQEFAEMTKRIREAEMAVS